MPKIDYMGDNVEVSEDQYVEYRRYMDVDRHTRGSVSAVDAIYNIITYGRVKPTKEDFARVKAAQDKAKSLGMAQDVRYAQKSSTDLLTMMEGAFLSLRRGDGITMDLLANCLDAVKALLLRASAGDARNDLVPGHTASLFDAAATLRAEIAILQKANTAAKSVARASEEARREAVRKREEILVDIERAQTKLSHLKGKLPEVERTVSGGRALEL